MKLTVLMDNNTYIDQYYLGEPALSIYIEDGEENILFDTGYSEAFISNAEKMQIDLGKLTYIVLSHGHNDHTRGLPFLWERYNLDGVKLVAHPSVFFPKRYMGLDVGAPFSRQDCLAHGLQIVDGHEPVQITERLTFLGEIPRVTVFESKAPVGECVDTGKGDFLLDDSALSYEGREGLFLVTGCSHSGICNIVLQALEMSEQEKINGIIGGFHLLKTDQQLTETIRFLEKHTTGMLFPCHCVSLSAKLEIMKALPVTEVGVGLQMEVR